MSIITDEFGRLANGIHNYNATHSEAPGPSYAAGRI